MSRLTISNQIEKLINNIVVTLDNVTIGQYNVIDLTHLNIDYLAIKHLDLSWNNLATVDDKLLLFPNLESINLSNNRLTTIPKHPMTVTSLDLSVNKIKNMEGFNPTPYNYINLCYNYIKSLKFIPSTRTITLAKNNLILAEYHITEIDSWRSSIGLHVLMNMNKTTNIPVVLLTDKEKKRYLDPDIVVGHYNDDNMKVCYNKGKYVEAEFDELDHKFVKELNTDLESQLPPIKRLILRQ